MATIKTIKQHATKKINVSNLMPVMLGFFAMGFVDVVKIASNYIKQDFH
jgi:hypothetical protein